MPAGEIARHALPGQGAREQSAGVTLAGRVPTTTEGGGGAPWCGGGVGRVWRRVGPPEDVTLGPSPVSRGESYSSCAKRLWRGRRVGRRPWGGEGTPGSTDSPRLARTSRRGGRSSCEAVAWPGALARASSLLRGRGEAWELRSAGA